MGANALESNISGTDNTAAGYEALYANTGSENTAVGFLALSTYGNGTGNTALGYDADADMMD